MTSPPLWARFMRRPRRAPSSSPRMGVQPLPAEDNGGQAHPARRSPCPSLSCSPPHLINSLATNAASSPPPCCAARPRPRSRPTARRVLDDVVLANIGVARSIASRYRSRGIATEDLEQVACAALVRAVHCFDGRLAERLPRLCRAEHPRRAEALLPRQRLDGPTAASDPGAPEPGRRDARPAAGPNRWLVQPRGHRRALDVPESDVDRGPRCRGVLHPHVAGPADGGGIHEPRSAT